MTIFQTVTKHHPKQRSEVMAIEAPKWAQRLAQSQQVRDGQ